MCSGGRPAAGGGGEEKKAAKSRRPRAGKEPMSNKFWRGVSETVFWWRRLDGQQEKSRYMGLYTRLLGYARPYLFPDLALAVLAMLVLSAANGAIPYLIKETINSLSLLKASNPLTVQ